MSDTVPTLDYASPAAIPLRFGRLALGSAILTLYPVALLAFQFLPTSVPKLMRTWGTIRLEMLAELILQLLAASALLAGIWLVANVLPLPRRAARWKHLTLLALASLNLFIVAFLYGHNLTPSLWKLTANIPDFLYRFLMCAIHLFLCLFALAAMVFLNRIARRARTSWLAIVASVTLPVSALVEFLTLVELTIYTVLMATNHGASPFFQFIVALPTALIHAADHLAQFALWTLIALWAAYCHRTSHSANFQPRKNES
jgi:hypothetical protein